jgi:hypothetical protein
MAAHGVYAAVMIDEYRFGFWPTAVMAACSTEIVSLETKLFGEMAPNLIHYNWRPDGARFKKWWKANCCPPQ